MRYYTHDTGGEIVYQIGDKVVHPMHGAGVIDSIVQRKVAGKLQEYYLLKLSVGSMTVMIPTENTQEIGVRPVVSGQEAESLMNAMENIEVDMAQNWNRRYRENMVRHQLVQSHTAGGACRHDHRAALRRRLFPFP